MKIVIQRVSRASVSVSNETIGNIGQGLMLLVAFNDDDTSTDIEYATHKIVNMRIFEDVDGKMNLSVKDVDGSILSISQFTLFASTKKGNRPSFTKSGNPTRASELFDEFNSSVQKAGLNVQTGKFGADMQVELVNDGPVTILLDTQNKE